MYCRISFRSCYLFIDAKYKKEIPCSYDLCNYIHRSIKRSTYAIVDIQFLKKVLAMCEEQDTSFEQMIKHQNKMYHLRKRNVQCYIEYLKELVENNPLNVYDNKVGQHIHLASILDILPIVVDALGLEGKYTLSVSNNELVVEKFVCKLIGKTPYLLGDKGTLKTTDLEPEDTEAVGWVCIKNGTSYFVTYNDGDKMYMI